MGIRSPDDSWARGKLREWKNLLNGEFAGPFSELLNLRRTGKEWHGFKSIEELAAALGEVRSYHLIYDPTSQMFVHPGDPDVHLIANGSAVQLRELVERDVERLDSVKQLLITEGYELLKAASGPWGLKGDLRSVIVQLLPLMIIALAPEHTATEERRRLEETSGIPDAQWSRLVHLTFDWKGPPGTSDAGSSG